jgi:solute carrier family 35 protein C2
MDHTNSDTARPPYQLDTLRQQPNAPRPTIPYSQFPRVTLQDRQAEDRREDAGYSTDASGAGSSSSISNDESMESSLVPSGQRRRRSANFASGEASQPRARGFKTNKDGKAKQEEGKLSDDEGRGSGYNSASTSDDFRLDSISDDDGLNDDEETGLTRNDKRRRETRRERNTLFDQRIVSEGSGGGKGLTAEEKKEADQHVVKRMGINAVLIGLWYTLLVI